jgi:heptosyltransferase-2
MEENPLKVLKWNKKELPKRILAIRLQAIGDVVITLSYLQGLRKMMPEDTVIDFLVREEADSIPKNLNLFNKVISIKGGRNEKKQGLWLLTLLPELLLGRYDVVLDLQNNRLSKLTRKIINPQCWVEFDKFSQRYAGERNRNTINATGFIDVKPDYNYSLRNQESGIDILKSNGWNGTDKLIVINPAGAFITRNWDLDNYIKFCRLFIKEFPKDIKFLVMGTEKIKEKAEYFKAELGDSLIDLTGKTTTAEAFSILQKIFFILTEDSGLMHMAYLSGKPTIGILGSTNSLWVEPKLPHTFCFTSRHLPCANCMQSTCAIGTLECLKSVTPMMVLEQALKLLNP